MVKPSISILCSSPLVLASHTHTHTLLNCGDCCVFSLSLPQFYEASVVALILYSLVFFLSFFLHPSICLCVLLFVLCFIFNSFLCVHRNVLVAISFSFLICFIHYKYWHFHSCCLSRTQTDSLPFFRPLGASLFPTSGF